MMREEGLLEDLRTQTKELQREYDFRFKQSQRIKRKRDQNKIEEETLKIRYQQEEIDLEKITKRVDDGK